MWIYLRFARYFFAHSNTNRSPSGHRSSEYWRQQSQAAEGININEHLTLTIIFIIKPDFTIRGPFTDMFNFNSSMDK